jgi:hypothetical protein
MQDRLVQITHQDLALKLWTKNGSLCISKKCCPNNFLYFPMFCETKKLLIKTTPKRQKYMGYVLFISSINHFPDHARAPCPPPSPHTFPCHYDHLPHPYLYHHHQCLLPSHSYHHLSPLTPLPPPPLPASPPNIPLHLPPSPPPSGKKIKTENFPTATTTTTAYRLFVVFLVLT